MVTLLFTCVVFEIPLSNLLVYHFFLFLSVLSAAFVTCRVLVEGLALAAEVVVLVLDQLAPIFLD